MKPPAFPVTARANPTYVRLLRNLLHSLKVDADALIVDLPREQPQWAEEFRKRCSGTLRFGAATLTFHVPDALLNLPCVTSDASAYASALRDCEALLAAFNDVSNAQQVRSILRTPQTLLRRLKREGCSYQSMLDEVRSSRALWYLRNTRLPVEEVAAQLGYVDTSSFGRTVRRWFGASPMEIRKGLEHA